MIDEWRSEAAKTVSHAIDCATTEKYQTADIDVGVSSMKIGVYIVILACATSGWATAQDAGDSSARSKILALEYAWDQAQERGDIKALSEIFDNSLIFVDYDGKILNKTEYLARVKSDASHLQQVVTESMNVQVLGATAIVVGTYRVKGVENGKPYLRRRRFLDTWTLVGGRWICIAAEATPIPH